MSHWPRSRLASSEFLAHGDAALPVDAHRYGAKGFLSLVRPR
jgi:hypothetical protein